MNRSHLCKLVGMVLILFPYSSSAQTAFQRSYDEYGCRIIGLALENTSLVYLYGNNTPKYAIDSTKKMLDNGKVDLPLQQVVMKRVGNLLIELLPLRSSVKTFTQARMISQKIGSYNRDKCLEFVRREPK